jgi:pSer/pThr/pTyr-binding forkhead associated (FHA) protein
MRDAFTDEDQPTLDPERSSVIKNARLRLVAVGDDVLVSHLLPESGTVLVGRAESTDLRVEHPVISRRHLVFRVAGRHVTVTHTGGPNGSKFRDERLLPQEPRRSTPAT